MKFKEGKPHMLFTMTDLKLTNLMLCQDGSQNLSSSTNRTPCPLKPEVSRITNRVERKPVKVNIPSLFASI